MPEASHKKISVIHTPCKDCVFAIYDGKTQVGCATGALEKFREKNYDVIEVYDNDNEFFVINNKKCLYTRDAAWYEKHGFNNTEEALAQALKENNLKYILLLDLSYKVPIQKIKDVVEDLKSQEIGPIGILVMSDKNDDKKYIQNIAKYLDSQLIRWRIQKFIDSELTKTQKIKSIIQSAPMNRYYFYIDPNKFIPNTIDVKKINTKILDGLVFGCLSIAGGLFFSYLSWQYAKSAKNIDIISEESFHTIYDEIIE